MRSTLYYFGGAPTFPCVHRGGFRCYSTFGVASALDEAVRAQTRRVVWAYPAAAVDTRLSSHRSWKTLYHAWLRLIAFRKIGVKDVNDTDPSD